MKYFVKIEVLNKEHKTMFRLFDMNANNVDLSALTHNGCVRPHCLNGMNFPYTNNHMDSFDIEQEEIKTNLADDAFLVGKVVISFMKDCEVFCVELFNSIQWEKQHIINVNFYIKEGFQIVVSLLKTYKQETYEQNSNDILSS